MQLPEEQSKALALKATALTIQCHEDYLIACAWANNIHSALKAIDADEDPKIRRAHEHHKAALDLKKAKAEKLLAAAAKLKEIQSAWLKSEDLRKLAIAREAEQKRLADIRAAEDAKIANASMLESAGYTEEAEAELAAPVEVAEAPKSEPDKIPGQRTIKVWKWKVIDEPAIPAKWWMLDDKAINEEARTYQDKASIPGIEFDYDLVAVRQ